MNRKEIIFVEEYNEEDPQVEQISEEEAAEFEDRTPEPNIFNRFWKGVKKVGRDAGTYMVTHPWQTAIGAGVLSTLIEFGGTIIKVNAKKASERTAWDASNGLTVHLKRDLRPDELKEFNDRKKAGETAIEILHSMRLLKK